MNNEEILQFIDTALQYLSAPDDARNAWNNGEVATTIKHFKRIQKSNIPGWMSCATTNLERLNEITGNTDLDDPKFIPIDTDLGLLCNSRQFFQCLNDGKIFNGAVHCESVLAGILDPRIRKTNPKFWSQTQVGFILV